MKRIRFVYLSRTNAKIYPGDTNLNEWYWNVPIAFLILRYLWLQTPRITANHKYLSKWNNFYQRKQLDNVYHCIRSDCGNVDCMIYIGRNNTDSSISGHSAIVKCSTEIFHLQIFLSELSEGGDDKRWLCLTSSRIMMVIMRALQYLCLRRASYSY